MQKFSDYSKESGRYPTGIRKKFVSRVIGGDWLPEDGSSYLVEDFPELHNAIGWDYSTSMDWSPPRMLPLLEGNIPPDRVNKIAINPAGTLIVVPSWGSPYFTLYRIEGASLTRLFDLPRSERITSIANSASFSPDGKYLVIGHSASPYFAVYEVNGEVLSRISIDAAHRPSIEVYDIAFINNTSFVATERSANKIFVYTISNNTVIKSAPLPADQVPSSGNLMRAAINPAGTLFAIISSSAPYLIFYKIDGYELTRLPDLAGDNGVSMTTEGLVFSQDGSKLAVAIRSSTLTQPPFAVYKVAGDTFTKMSNPPRADWPTNGIYGVDLSSDGSIMLLAGTAAPYLFHYKIENNQVIKLPYSDRTPQVDMQLRHVALSRDNKTLVIGGNYFPYLSAFHTDLDVNQYTGIIHQRRSLSL